MRRQGPVAITELLTRHGLVPRKAYGQHFLADPNLIDKVVATADVRPGDRVLEVGAGTGALTAALAATGARVLAYELDGQLRPVLAEVLDGLGVDLRFADVMEVDLSAELDGTSWKLVSNLPYNVGTPLVLDVLTGVPQVDSVVVMMQREVVDRLVAAPGTSDYGVPSVVVGLTSRVVDRFDVGRRVFVPAPQVSSAVVRLDRTTPPEGFVEAIALARTAFGQRRKMLRRSLADVASPEDFERARIDPSGRPEELSPAEFLALAKAVSARA